MFWDCYNLRDIVIPPNIVVLENDVFFRCKLLTKVEIQGTVSGISSRVFDGCESLTTITAPFLSDTPFNPNQLIEILNQAGYSNKHGNPDAFLYNKPTIQNSHMSYNLTTWAQTHAEYNRYPLCTAAARSLPWNTTTQVIFHAYMPALYEVDWLTGLGVFMLAAVGENSDLESVYNLLKENPVAIGRMGERQKGIKDRNAVMPASPGRCDDRTLQFSPQITIKKTFISKEFCGFLM